MKTLETIEYKGNAAVRRLRMEKLAKGYHFMINSKDLPERQCYIEHPNGAIELASLSPTSRDFVIIRKLSLNESLNIRAKFKL